MIRKTVEFSRRFVVSVLVYALVMLALASCGGIIADSPPKEPSDAPTKQRTVETDGEEDSGNAAESTRVPATGMSSEPGTSDLSELAPPETPDEPDGGTWEYADPPYDGAEEYIGSSGAEASIEEEVGDYYRAAGAGEWAYTYDHLAMDTRSMFTEDEWFEKNQWLWDRNPLIYHITSINSDGSSAEVELRITSKEDGSSRTSTAYFILEDGEWRHLFSEAEISLFMPGTSFEEFIEVHGGSSDESGVCAGISDCETVDTADVDGDGLLDEVAIVGEPDEYSSEPTWVTVRVLLSDGTTLSRDSKVEFWSLPVYHGATDFGQVPGEEIVVGAMSGAHTLSYRVLTYRDGELVELPHPNVSYEGSSIWPIDAAASISMGIECDPSDSTVVLRSVSSVGPGGEGGFEGEETRWVLEGDGWRMVDSTSLSYPEGESAFEISGWFCGDLPRGYG